jgi:hypothetical protein
MIRLLFIFAVLVAGCSKGGPNSSVGTTQTITIEGCQYWQYSERYYGQTGRAITITHKGNCPNPIHKCTCPPVGQ